MKKYPTPFGDVFELAYIFIGLYQIDLLLCLYLICILSLLICGIVIYGCASSLKISLLACSGARSSDLSPCTSCVISPSFSALHDLVFLLYGSLCFLISKLITQ